MPALTTLGLKNIPLNPLTEGSGSLLVEEELPLLDGRVDDGPSELLFVLLDSDWLDTDELFSDKASDGALDDSADPLSEKEGAKLPEASPE